MKNPIKALKKVKADNLDRLVKIDDEFYTNSNLSETDELYIKETATEAAIVALLAKYCITGVSSYTITKLVLKLTNSPVAAFISGTSISMILYFVLGPCIDRAMVVAIEKELEEVLIKNENKKDNVVETKDAEIVD